MDLFNKCVQYYPIVDTAKKVGYYPYFIPLCSEPDRRVMIDGKELIMLGSNNYLGLTTHPKLKKAAIDAIRKYGTGCTGSRFLNGTLDIHIQLEKELAKFYHKEDCIVFSTGYQTNLGVISSLVHKGDVLLADKLDHASIVDGCKMSYGRAKRFLHNKPDSLERVLKKLPKEAGKLIVVDGVFSMEGDLAPLDKILPIAKKYGCRIMVDDAHAIGVVGKNGRGTAEYFGVEDDVDLIMGTFSKSFATIGGYVVGEHKVITYIRHQARSLIFSASIPPPSVATVLAALEVIQTEPDRRARLWRNARKMLKGLKKMGYNTGTSATPIIPLHIGEYMKTLNFWRNLFDGGIFANPVIPPAVPPNRSLIRTSYMATHTDEDTDEALALFEKLGKKFGVLG
ncbi:8-amino-7-oxononanoate synthase [candidate division WOR-3 bacterium JGI_Cruoil_03_51_56]|uniref:8-amino-7-oxononanoate synthase n=1 Tax=candidate division WOR-3 bacterium JGI_Cruoil_03_51_56 TaxID=1973747 RepID=A0A235BW57_UNCW3|nr:MAG: 8-amino-7-oxononanoate synthase [candidate division WOR-3 bacterium JGI_Cruoil_03_51_56]